MRNWDFRDEEGNDVVCTQGEDYKEAKKVAEFLDIPFYEVDFIGDYWNDVFSPFLDAYEEVFNFCSNQSTCSFVFVRFDLYSVYVAIVFNDDNNADDQY